MNSLGNAVATITKIPPRWYFFISEWSNLDNPGLRRLILVVFLGWNRTSWTALERRTRPAKGTKFVTAPFLASFSTRNLLQWELDLAGSRGSKSGFWRLQYAYIHVYSYAYKYSYLYSYNTHAYTYTYAHTHTHLGLHRYTHTHTQRHTHTHTHIGLHGQNKDTYTHAHILILMYIFIYIEILRRTHTHPSPLHIFVYTYKDWPIDILYTMSNILIV